MSPVHFALLPRDGVFMKDGRGWYTSDTGRSHAHPWPLPPTLRGALRAAWGHAFMERTGERLSPAEWERRSQGVELHRVLTLRRNVGEEFTSTHRMWPAPADALYQKGQEHITRLLPERPRHASLGSTDDPALEALFRAYPPKEGKPEPPPMFWTDADMIAWLQGKDVKKQSGVSLSPSRRLDIHVTISAETQTATPSMMFSSEVTEPLAKAKDGWHEWAIGVGCTLPEGCGDIRRHPVFLGGRRRISACETIKGGIFASPREWNASRGLRLVLVTPAEFSGGWLPDGFAVGQYEDAPAYLGKLPGLGVDLVLRAAMVPRPLHLSTWNTVERKPRPTRRLVRPGAVYFFEKASKQPFSSKEFESMWLTAIGGGREDGLGLVIPGGWSVA